MAVVAAFVASAAKLGAGVVACVAGRTAVVPGVAGPALEYCFVVASPMLVADWVVGCGSAAVAGVAVMLADVAVCCFCIC